MMCILQTFMIVIQRLCALRVLFGALGKDEVRLGIGDVADTLESRAGL